MEFALEFIYVFAFIMILRQVGSYKKKTNTWCKVVDTKEGKTEKKLSRHICNAIVHVCALEKVSHFIC